jgi:hypothetical protein
MASHFFYSTNTFMKKVIQERYRNNSHYIWCGENFDATVLAKHSGSSLVAPSSNPADIYRELKIAVERKDKHCSKITEQRTTFLNLAIEWASKGEITIQDKEDITYMVNEFDIDYWRPVLYIIPRSIIDVARIKTVAMKGRASFGTEYIIEDLKAHEFDLIEF